MLNCTVSGTVERLDMHGSGGFLGSEANKAFPTTSVQQPKLALFRSAVIDGVLKAKHGRGK